MGDTVSLNGIFTTESLEECKKHMNSIMFYVSPNGDFYNTLDTQNAKMVLTALTYADDEKLSKIIPE